MTIIDFTAAHIEQAARIAKQNYEAERGYVPALPPVNDVLDLTPFAENGLGAAAFDGDTMIGFLCCCAPFDNAFGISGLRGVFSPMGANGTVPENRAAVYARLYQAAAAKWVRAGAASHAVCLYAHDAEGQLSFFRYGFGMRTVDAIRGMDEISAPSREGYTFAELAPEDILDLLPLDNLLDGGHTESPFFMYKKQNSEAQFLEEYRRSRSFYCIAKHNAKTVAYIRAELDGETFIQGTPGYLHCKGLYCLPEHRGKGVPQNLLNLLSQKLGAQGYTRLGVDFESINPSGSGFWRKHFDAYAHSVVRRIDESVIKTKG